MSDYIFKTRILHDRRSWEDIPPHGRQSHPTLDAAIAQATRTADHPAVVEVRVNADGSYQGYYYPGPHETIEKHRGGKTAVVSLAC